MHWREHSGSPLRVSMTLSASDGGGSADTALRLARYFGGDARSWLNLLSAYELRVAEIANARRVAREVTPAVA
jgi:plasmid maintenance system antidote protein VapI